MASKAPSKSSMFFKKSSSSSFQKNSLRRVDRLLKILRRLRPVLVKDLAVCEILERLSSDDVIGCRLPRCDVDDLASSSSSPSSSWRVESFLDRLERTDEAVVCAVVDAVRHRHKHIASLIDNMINNYNSDDYDDDDDNDGCARGERSTLAGEALRTILRKKSAIGDRHRRRRRCVHREEEEEEEERSEAGQQQTQSPPSDLENSDDESDDYLNCFVVCTRGKGQTERWMRHEDVPRTKQEKEEGKRFMAVATKDLVFRSTDPSLLPDHVRRPPTTCREVFVVDRDSRYSRAAESKDSGRSHVMKGRSFKGHDLRSKSSLRTESFLNRQRDIYQMTSLPPPLPPKPDYLPHLSFLSAEEAGNQSRSNSPTDQRDALGSIKGGRATLAPTRAPPLPRRSEVHKVPDYWRETSNSEKLKAKANGGASVGLGETDRDWSKEGDDDDELSLNFAVEVEETENVDDYEDPYEAVSHPEDTSDDVPLSRTSQHRDRKEEAETDQLLESKSVDTFSSDLSAKETRIPSSSSPASSTSPKPPELHTRIKSDATQETEEESNTDFPGKLSARDSGVDSVASQGFPESPIGPESAAEPPEVFLPCSATGHSKTTEEEEEEGVISRASSSSSYSYYEDIETFNVQPGTSRSMGTGSTSDRKMIPTGSLFLTETDDACVASGEEDDRLAVYRRTVLGYDREGVAFYCPRDALRRFGDPEDEDWFYPIPLTPHEATVFLHRENQKGCFVVYRPRRTNSSHAPPVRFLLSVCCGGGGGGGGGAGDVVHYSIVENVRGDFKVEGHDHSFMTLGDLVTYFRRNQSHLAMRLRRPLKSARTPIQPGLQYPERMEIAKNEIQLDATIMGGHVTTTPLMFCLGQWNGSSVTVKVIPKDSSAEGEDDFVEEALTLMSLRHENVIRLLGLSCRTHPFYMVTEYLERGSLAECLRSRIIRPESIEDLFDVCLQVVAAMSYLESRRFVLHRTLAAKNFFVTKDLLIKLAHFDRARVVLDDDYLACDTEEVQVRWAAPEVLKASSYSTKSDVWAAGVVFWEVHSAGVTPYAKLTDEETAAYVANGGRLEKPEHCSRDLFVLMKTCWQPLTSDRPSFAVIEEKFKGNSSVYYSSGQTRLLPLPPPPPPPSLSVPSSPGIFRVPRLPVKVKVAANPSKSPTVVTKKRHLSTLRESRSAEGALQTTTTCGGGGGGGLKVPLPAMCSSGGERVPTSSSDSSSVVSASVSNEFENKEDLSRGDKIRKSIRKLIIGKKTAK